MERHEAVLVLKELFGKIARLEGKSVALMPPDADSVLADGYQIHIKAKVEDEMLSQIEHALDGCCLKIRKENNLIVIYKPLKARNC